MDGINWVNFILVLLVIILIIFIYIAFFSFSSRTETNGVPWRIQHGTTTGTTDTLTTGGNVLYIARTGANKLTLQVPEDGSNTEGRQFTVKNILGSGNVTLTGTGGLNFSGRGANGDAPTTVSKNQLGWYVFTATNSAFRII